MQQNKRLIYKNIAFARGGAHLPIAHALGLLSTQELLFGLTKLNLRRKKEKKWGKGPPPKKIISKNYFFSFSIPGWTAGGVRALWVSEHPIWRTRYLFVNLISVHRHKFRICLFCNVTIFRQIRWPEFFLQ